MHTVTHWLSRPRSSTHKTSTNLNSSHIQNGTPSSERKFLWFVLFTCSTSKSFHEITCTLIYLWVLENYLRKSTIQSTASSADTIIWKHVWSLWFSPVMKDRWRNRDSFRQVPNFRVSICGIKREKEDLPSLIYRYLTPGVTHKNPQTCDCPFVLWATTSSSHFPSHSSVGSLQPCCSSKRKDHCWSYIW